MDNDERILVERAKSDPEAFGELYDRYVDRVYGFLVARLHNAALAEDVTAEVFVSALRGIARYRDQGRPFSCWLFRIAANAAISHFRGEPIHTLLGDDQRDPGLSVESVVLRNLELAQVWDLVDRLPAQQRRAMQLRFHEDLSARDAARVMRKSEAAVKLLIYRAVGRLRAQLSVPHSDAPEPSAPSVT